MWQVKSSLSLRSTGEVVKDGKVMLHHQHISVLGVVPGHDGPDDASGLKKERHTDRHTKTKSFRHKYIE